MATTKMAFVFGLILLSFVTGGKCSDVDCGKIPIENLEPCKEFVLGTTEKPRDECCKGVKSWLGVPPEVVCECYRQSPRRLSYKPDEIRAAALPYVCGAPGFYSYIPCLVAK